MFLSLLKPGGKMVVVIDDEAVLVTRGGEDAHDFVREVIGHIGGDFGELEDPTPWEVQEAIRRIKERERRRGSEQVGGFAELCRSLGLCICRIQGHTRLKPFVCKYVIFCSSCFS